MFSFRKWKRVILFYWGDLWNKWRTCLCRYFYCKVPINILQKVSFYCSLKWPLTNTFNCKVAVFICHWKLYFYSSSFHLNFQLRQEEEYFPSCDFKLSMASTSDWKVLFVLQDLNFSWLSPLLLFFILPFLHIQDLSIPLTFEYFPLNISIRIYFF